MPMLSIVTVDGIHSCCSRFSDMRPVEISFSLLESRITETISQMQFIFVTLSKARNLKLGTGLDATISDSSLRSE